MSPVVRRCFSIGDQCPNVLLFFHLNSFCRVFFSSTGATTSRLSLILANGRYNVSRHTPVYNIPFRSTSSCVTGLMGHNCGITVYRRLRSPGLIGKLIGESIMEVVAPNAIVRNGVLSSSAGGCLYYVYHSRGRAKLYFTSISATRFRLATVGNTSNRGGVVSRLTTCVPGRILIGSTTLSCTHTTSFLGTQGNARTRLLRSRGFSCGTTARLVLRALGGSRVSDLSLNDDGPIIHTLNTIVNCLGSIRGGRRVRTPTSVSCFRDSQCLGLSVGTHHGLRLAGSVVANSGERSLL